MLIDSKQIAKQSAKQLGKKIDEILGFYRAVVSKEAMAGGVQSLIMKEKLQLSTFDECQGSATTSQINFDKLPISIKLIVFSHLNARDLAHCSMVSTGWNKLCCDEYLWRDLLQRDKVKWTRVASERDPDALESAVGSEVSNKQIFQVCHGNAKQSLLSVPSPSLLQLLTPFRPRIVMFGPGLETKTSKLVRILLTDTHTNENYRFQVTGMVPGSFSGMGSGISLKLGERNFNLITLYSNFKAVRTTRRLHEERVRYNRLFVQDDRGSYELAPGIRDLCRHTAGLIFVVDAAQSFEDVRTWQSELSAVLCELWTPSAVPLLVLSCTRDSEPRTLGSLDVKRALRLERTGRRWLVQDGHVDSLIGIREGLCWLLGHI